MSTFVIRRTSNQPWMADPITHHHYWVPAPTAETALRIARSWRLTGELEVMGPQKG